MKKQLSLICLLVSLAACVWAYLDDYSPFEPGTAPKPFPVTELKEIARETSDSQGTFAKAPDSFPRLVLSWATPGNADDCTLSVIGARGVKILAGAKITADSPRYVAVYAALLNEDTEPDYVIRAWSGGCGLAAEWFFLTFLLSTGATYSVTETACMAMGVEDFVDLNNDGRGEFIHTSFVGGEKGKDGKSHNYWVYNLLRFKGGQIISANDLDRRFPCWVWYKFKPNHQNTDQLTPKQRMRCWRNEWSKDRLMLSLEKEQGRMP